MAGSACALALLLTGCSGVIDGVSAVGTIVGSAVEKNADNAANGSVQERGEATLAALAAAFPGKDVTGGTQLDGLGSDFVFTVTAPDIVDFSPEDVVTAVETVCETPGDPYSTITFDFRSPQGKYDALSVAQDVYGEDSSFWDGTNGFVIWTFSTQCGR